MNLYLKKSINLHLKYGQHSRLIKQFYNNLSKTHLKKEFQKTNYIKISYFYQIPYYNFGELILF